MRVVSNGNFVPELGSADAPQAQAEARIDSNAPASFQDELSRFVDEVATTQASADGEASKLAHGAGNVHETALALEKADIEMRLLMKGRNKIIEAYQEISRMPL